ncbi:MAG: TnpV protein [Agathobacter sp.]|nr:TnpV protein [Agathobacter sp.]
MSRELTLIERMGVEFEERDGLFYPFVVGDTSKECVKTKDIGKYGHLWINFMQEVYPEGYRSLVRFRLLEEKALAVNEEAYELLCVMEEKLLAESDTGKSFVEIYELRTQVRMLVEEIVIREIVNEFH